MALRAMADRRHLLYRRCVVFVRLGSRTVFVKACLRR
jgi:hypothetical protein